MNLLYLNKILSELYTMIQTIIILFLTMVAFAAKKCDPYTPGVCNTHTNLYNQYINGTLTFDLVQKNTFLTTNPCDTSYLNIKSKYLKRLDEANIVCNGTWCVNDNFECKQSNDQCYNIDHIIDTKNSIAELNNYDKNIVGNLIMIYSEWKNELDQRSWKIIEEEKKKVFGDNIFYKAYDNVKGCGVINPNIITNFAIFDSIFLIIFMIIIVLCNRKRKKEDNMEYDLYKDIQGITIN